jgi:hypothetical protein
MPEQSPINEYLETRTKHPNVPDGWSDANVYFDRELKHLPPSNGFLTDDYQLGLHIPEGIRAIPPRPR